MSRRVERHDAVEGDILECARYIAKDSLDAALRFFDAVDITANGLARMPRKGARMRQNHKVFASVRYYPIDGFPNHLIVYQPTENGIFVLTIVHGARRYSPIVKARLTE